MKEITELDYQFLSKFYDDDVNHIEHLEYFTPFKQTVNSVHDLMVRVYGNYPLDSEPYKIFRRFFEDNWLKPLYPTEHVLCYKRKSAYPNYDDIEFSEHFGYLDETYRELFNGAPKGTYRLTYLPRWKVEWNPEYVHFVVGGLIHTRDDGYILLHRNGGQFNDKLTTVMGHCAYTEEAVYNAYSLFCKPMDCITEYDLKTLLVFDMAREILEEVGIFADTLDFGLRVGQDNLPYYYRPPNKYDITTLSYYHGGFLFNISTTTTSDKIVSQEPDKNTVVRYTFDQLKNITRHNTDGWLYDLLCKNGIINPNVTKLINMEMFKP